MPYPSTISSLTDPQASDRLNNPSHSALHQSENTAIEEVQTFVGTLSSAVGTLVYDIRSANSNGGGHVQAANKGGTGQTSFTKGDMLVATSSSVIAKLAIGAVNQVLTVNPAQAGGVEWQSPNRTTISTASISLAAGASSVETAYFAASVAGSVMSDVSSLRFTGYLRQFDSASDSGFNLKVKLGGSTVGSLTIGTNLPSNSSIVGSAVVSGQIVGNSTLSSIVGFVRMDTAGRTTMLDAPLTNNMSATASIAAAIDTSRGRDLVITGLYAAATGTRNSVLTGIFTTERL